MKPLVIMARLEGCEGDTPCADRVLDYTEMLPTDTCRAAHGTAYLWAVIRDGACIGWVEILGPGLPYGAGLFRGRVADV